MPMSKISLAVMLVFLLLSLYSLMVVPVQSVYASSLQIPSEPPSPPSAVGCYHYTKTEGWVSVPCLSQAQVRAFPATDTDLGHHL